MAFEDLPYRRSAYVRLLLLLLGEVIAGVFLYVVFMFVPTMVEVLIVVAALVVGLIYDFDYEPEKSISLVSLLCGITGLFTALCSIAWRIPRLKIAYDDVLFRLMLVGTCLLSALVFLERRGEIR